ncbi:MAG: alpha/beta fold hydrolase [Gammaproteobacteria bacterium]|nr:alpha/beta fold hydrolase [Gammaproteobacteria bacterium]
MIFFFDGYEVNDSNFEIRHEGRLLDAQPQVFELLVFLLHNRNRFVSRDEIFEAIWKNRVVSDTTLSGYIKAVRKLVGDDGKAQRVIRTVHGRGFQFVAELDPGSCESVQTVPDRAGAVNRPTTRYAKSGDVHVAYQVFGSGPADLVLVPGFISHVDNYWDNPQMAAWLQDIGKFARVVMFDKRGTGLSDTVYPLPSFDVRMDDVRAVMDAVGLDKACIMGISEGGSLATLFAATHPERCSGLVLYGAFSRFFYWYKTPGELQGLFDYVESAWGSGESLPMFAPSVGQDEAAKRWWGQFERLGATPGAAIALMKMNSEIDITDILPTIGIPTLVIHRNEDVLIDIEAGRLLADRIPRARYVELPGRDHLPWVGDSDAIIGAIADFIGDGPLPAALDTILTTLLSVHPGAGLPEGPDGPFDEAQSAVDRCISHYRGRTVSASLAAFDGPARAVHCACEIIDRLRAMALNPHCGIHTGVVLINDNALSGETVDRVEQISRLAPGGQAILSETVKDLIAGAGLEIRALGRFDLPAGNGGINLFSASRATA